MTNCVPGQKNKHTPRTVPSLSLQQCSLQVKWKEKHIKRKKILSLDEAIFLFCSFISVFGPRGPVLLLRPRQDFYCSWTQTTYRAARACTQTLLGDLFFGDFPLFLVLHHLWGTITLMWPPHHFLSHHFRFILWPHDALTEAGKWPGCWTNRFL